MEKKIYKPRAAVYVLKPSRIHGVGVFTARPIKGHTRLDLFDWGEKTITATFESHGYYAHRYGVKIRGGYCCPETFHRMSIGWYLNHSDRPNTYYREETDCYYARRALRKGIEITIDYREKIGRY